MSHLKFLRLFPIRAYKDFEGDTLILGYISDSVDWYRVNVLYKSYLMSGFIDNYKGLIEFSLSPTLRTSDAR